LVSAEAHQAGVHELLENASAALARLEALKQEYAARAQAAGERLAAETETARQSFDQYKERLAETRSLEEEAIKKLEQASRAFSTARNLADARVNDVPTLSPAQEEESPVKLIREDRWLSAQLRCQAADANVWKALVLYDRYDHLKTVLAKLGDIEANVVSLGFSPTETEAEIESTRATAEESLTDAINSIESAGRDLKQHWSVAATVAGAEYVLALFDNPAMVELAMANYRAVVQDRETNPFVRPFVERLNQLRNR
jgi:hypothetical protein